RLLVCILLMLFGGAVAMGLLAGLSWEMVLFTIIFLLLVRPLTALLGLITTKLPIREKLAISFFGIRGMGSIFYLAFGLNEFNFLHQEELWAIVSFTIFISILLHGLTANPVMKHLKDKS